MLTVNDFLVKAAALVLEVSHMEQCVYTLASLSRPILKTVGEPRDKASYILRLLC